MVLVFPPFRRKTLRLSTPELVLRPVHSAARKSIDSELTPARAAGVIKMIKRVNSLLRCERNAEIKTYFDEK